MDFGYTEHSYRHISIVSKRAGDILEKLQSMEDITIEDKYYLILDFIDEKIIIDEFPNSIINSVPNYSELIDINNNVLP